jgi:hypothetical protein
MRMITRPKEPFILQDRVLLSALLFGSAGYIVIGSWAGVTLLTAGFMMGVVWAFRTASSHPNRVLRILATVLMVSLGAFMTVYIAANQGVLR